MSKEDLLKEKAELTIELNKYSFEDIENANQLGNLIQERDEMLEIFAQIDPSKLDMAQTASYTYYKVILRELDDSLLGVDCPATIEFISKFETLRSRFLTVLNTLAIAETLDEPQQV